MTPKCGMYISKYAYYGYSIKPRYTEAIQLFKSSQDTAWHAAALEGIATVSMIEAWSAGNGLVRLMYRVRAIA
jgi:hypothetical protein